MKNYVKAFSGFYEPEKIEELIAHAEKRLTFKTREEYFSWVKEWKEVYAFESQTIRELRGDYKDMQRKTGMVSWNLVTRISQASNGQTEALIMRAASKLRAAKQTEERSIAA